MMIRIFSPNDYPMLERVWNECVSNGDALYRPLNEQYFRDKFLSENTYDAFLLLVAEENGEVIGFISGSRKKAFLAGENDENTPGFINTLMVRPACRSHGAGSMLVSGLEDAFRRLGKKNLDVSSLSPMDLDWRIPGTPEHEHNNMPGMDEGSLAYGFLQKRGYVPRVHEVAMYLNLSDYRKTDEIENKRSELAAQGIKAGLYDPKENCEWDGMCGRVGSEYWRKVLRDELASPSPRPILAARTQGHIVGFTGPVDVQTNGRGWFTGICTDPLYEKRGIATVLFNDLMNEFIKVGAKYSSLFTGTENHAQRLYLKTGFRPARTFAFMRKEL
jgi:ribosomal protein S18 acetylase RimI-like enzyme